MRALMIALAVAVLPPAAARAEDIVGINPNGIMCRDEKALAEFTAPNGSEKPGIMANSFSPTAKRFMTSCQGIGGATVHVVTRRNNTSIVTYNGQTWYVPNIDFMTPTPDCIKEGTKLTMVGKIETGFKQTDEVDPKKGYRYPRLTLDKPVCFLGNQSVAAGRYISLVGSGAGAFQTLMKAVGQHVAVTGQIDSPDNGNQPPDAMVMFDPVVKPAG